MTPEPYLDVLIIDPDYGKSKEVQPQIQEEKAPRETQAELKSFC